VRARLTFSPEAAGRVFDRAYATLVWLAVLVFLSSEPSVRGLAIAAMVAVALASSIVACLPRHPAPNRCPTIRRLIMAYEHDEIGDFASERDAQDWAERNNIDPSDLHFRARGKRGVTLSVRRSALGDSSQADLSFGRRTGFF
jgi:hypothetical protein